MGIKRLDHYSIRTTRLDETQRFYTEVMGFEVGPRPDFPFPGVWLYQDGIAVVHVVGIDPNDPQGLIAYLGEKGIDGASGTGTIDHVAFLCDDLDGMRRHLQTCGLDFRERAVPNMALHQIFLEDPNGVTLELNFPTA
jgi:catechol 2,3-dioxygenase-like lactoylglutathione lyase family enzyme